MDWDKIKAEYIAGGIGYRKLAEKHGIPFSTLKRVAVKESWAKLKEQAKEKADTELANLIGKANAKKALKINDIADKLLEKISTTLDSLPVIDSQSIKHFTSALKDIKDIKGIKSELDLREQKARIDKLIKDAEDQKDKTTEVAVIFEGGEEDWQE